MGSVLACCAAQCACEAATCCIGLGCSCCCKATNAAFKKSTITRVSYLIIFLFISMVAWILDAYADEILKWAIVGVPHEIIGVAAVYRLMAALAVFHLILAVVMAGVRSSQDPRSYLQDGLWFIKVFLLVGLTIGAFYLPNDSLVTIGWISLFGAAVFILIQLLLLVDAAYVWNAWMLKSWRETDNDNWFYMLLTLSAGMYIFSLALSIVMYSLYGSGSGCGLNIFFTTFNLVAVIVISLAAVSPKVQEANEQSGLLQAAVVGAYATYLVMSAMLSEGSDWPCTSKLEHDENSGVEHATTILGAVFSVAAVCYSAIRVSMSEDSLLGDGAEYDKLKDTDDDLGEGAVVVHDEETNGVVYSYSFFHLTFALAAMYMMMLFTNWAVLHANDGGVNVNSGTAAVWVKVVSSWLTHVLYVWTLIAPICLPDRDFSH